MGGHTNSSQRNWEKPKTQETLNLALGVGFAMVSEKRGCL